MSGLIVACTLSSVPESLTRTSIMKSLDGMSMEFYFILKKKGFLTPRRGKERFELMTSVL